MSPSQPQKQQVTELMPHFAFPKAVLSCVEVSEAVFRHLTYCCIADWIVPQVCAEGCSCPVLNNESARLEN
jgi:hypothetical protein